MKGILSIGSLSPLKNIFLRLLNGSVKKIQLYFYSVIDLIIITIAIIIIIIIIIIIVITLIILIIIIKIKLPLNEMFQKKESTYSP